MREHGPAAPALHAELLAAIERFLSVLAARELRPATLLVYRTTIASFLGFLLTDLREATRAEVVDWLGALELQGVASSSLSGRLGRLRRLFAHLLECGLVLEDPTAGLRRKAPTYVSHPALSRSEVGRLLGAPDVTTDRGLRDRAILELYYSSGLRRGELLALELEDLDLVEGFVTVRAGKNGHARRVPIGRVAIEWVSRYLKRSRPRFAKRRPRALGPTAVVFLGRLGIPLGREMICRIFQECRRQAGVREEATAHALRHSFAVHLLKGGASTRHIQEMLGHRDLETTQIYTRLLPKDLKDVLRRAHPRERRKRRR